MTTTTTRNPSVYTDANPTPYRGRKPITVNRATELLFGVTFTRPDHDRHYSAVIGMLVAGHPSAKTGSVWTVTPSVYRSMLVTVRQRVARANGTTT